MFKFWVMNFIYYLKLQINYQRIIEDESQDKLYQLLGNYVKNTLKVMKIDIIVRNKEIIEELDESALFIANHGSIYDSLFTYQAIGGRTTFFAAGDKRDVTKNKRLYKIAQMGDMVFINRKSLRESVKSIKKGTEILNKGKNLIIFPEGEVNDHLQKNGREIAEFHIGSFRPAINAQKPIVPVAIIGANKIHNSLNMNSRINSGKVEVAFLKPVTIHLVKEIKPIDLAKYVEDEIDRYLKENNG